MQKRSGADSNASYAWVILAVLFAGNLMSYGVRSSFGAFISPWETEFGVGRTIVTTISMLSFIVIAVTQPFAGKLNDIFGKGIVPTFGVFLVGITIFLTSRTTQIWQILLVYGIGFSIGVACCTNSVVASITTSWFVKKRGFALGLATSGMAVGQLILVPVNLFIIGRFGWSAAFMVMGLVIVVILGPVFIFLMRSRPEEKGLKPYGYVRCEDEGGLSGNTALNAKKTLPVIRILKVKAFWWICIPYFICGFTDVGLIQTHLIPMSQGRGFPSSTVALTISLIAFANIAGTIGTGYLSDHFNRRRQLMVIFAVRALSILFLIFIRQAWLLFPFAIVFGLTEMATIAPVSSISIEIFDKYSPGVVLGVITLSHKFGGSVGSWIPGILFDLTGSYNTIFIFSIILLVSASLFSMRIPEVDKKKSLRDGSSA